MILKELLSGYKVILGSASPRRREILKGIDIDFEVDATTHTPEIYNPSSSHEEIALSLAILKSEGFHRELCPKEILITADTIVLCPNFTGNEEILGKPKDREDAYRMLRLLSGRSHKVVTGVCLRDASREYSFAETSTVTFREITDEEIYYYIDHYQPFDKAGGYGIQEWIGLIAISSIEGSYFNIVGLPVEKLYVSLVKFMTQEDVN